MKRGINRTRRCGVHVGRPQMFAEAFEGRSGPTAYDRGPAASIELARNRPSDALGATNNPCKTGFHASSVQRQPTLRRPVLWSVLVANASDRGKQLSDVGHRVESVTDRDR